MTKGLLLLGIGAMICSAASAAPFHKEASAKNEKFELAKQQVKKINARNAANEGIWRAGVVSNYYWDYGTWTQYNELQCSYYPNGLLKEEYSEEGFRNVYEYDSDGRLISESNYSMYYGEEEELESVRTYEYDPILKDLVVYTYEDYPLFGYGIGSGKEITRNELGNIVLVKGYSIWAGEKNYNGDTLIIEYDEENAAVKIIDQYEGEDWSTGEQYTVVNSVLTNILWENTDGQIYDINIDDPLSPIFVGANRIKRCNIDDLELPCAAKFDVYYEGEDYDAVIELENGETYAKMQFTSLDENGSYKYSIYGVDLDEEDGDIYIAASQEGIITHVVDQFGLVLEESEYYLEHFEDGDEIFSESIMGEVTYDEVYGYPLEYVVSSKSGDDDEFELQERVVYSDYAHYDATVGVGSVAGSANEKVEFYNLNGVRVDNPANGIFIRRQGDKVSKVIIK